MFFDSYENEGNRQREMLLEIALLQRRLLELRFDFASRMPRPLPVKKKGIFGKETGFPEGYARLVEELSEKKRRLEIWRRHSDKSTKLYVLSGYESQGAEEIASIFERIRILMEYQCLPYIMRHEYYNSSPYKGMFITLARWCNQPNFLKKKSFRQFCEANGPTSSACRYMSQFEHDHPDIAGKYFDIRFDRRGAK